MGKTAYFNGKIYTASAAAPTAEAFIVENGKFSFIGKESELPECDEKVDLEGRCVIPGLVDSHCHMLAGLYMATMDVKVFDSATKPEDLGNILFKLIEHEDHSENETMAFMGFDLTMGRFSAKDIDPYISDHPVLVFSADGHALLLNSKAMEELGINKDTKDPAEDSYYERDASGNPTGLVIELPAMRPCQSLLKNPSPESLSEILRKHSIHYSSKGYTSIFEAMSIDDERTEVPEALQSLDKTGNLTIRIVTSFGYNGEDHLEAEEAIRLMERNRKLFSSENVIHDTLKLISDGTVEEHSALLCEPYSDEEDNLGSELLSPEEMAMAARLAAEKGFSVHIHAIGDKAVSRALDVLLPLRDLPGTRTIAHNQIYSSADIERMTGAKDIFFQTTPHWMTGDSFTLSSLGEHRYKAQFPVGTMQRNGVAVTFGSDSCLEEETANAFLGMFYACARGNEELCGEDCLPPESEGISRMESLQAYTINGARQLGIDKVTGSISEGKSADFVITDRDVIECPLEELEDTKVLKTFFHGKAVYDHLL